MTRENGVSKAGVEGVAENVPSPGDTCLPDGMLEPRTLVIIGGSGDLADRKLVPALKTYYKPEDLPKFPDIGQQMPALAEKFFDYYNAVFAEGALTEREKALIALAIAHAVQCPYCIDASTQACLEKGSNLEEMTEAVHVVTAIRGGASPVHGVQMRNIAPKLSM